VFLPKLKEIFTDIETRILPELKSLCQRDTDEFDKLNALRTRRKTETDVTKLEQLERQIQHALKVVADIPIKIANLALEVAEYAKYVFDRGFKTARGDSSVALNAAISAANGCISIIYLNLNEVDSKDGRQKLRNEVNALRQKLGQISIVPFEQHAALEKEVNELDLYYDAVNNIRYSHRANSSMSERDIENLARQIQNTLWIYRKKFWKKDTPQEYKDVLDPGVVLTKILKYRMVYSQSLGTNELNGDIFRVAGIINKKDKVVHLSDEFPLQTMCFTAAHELGHALLHNQIMLHRDKPIDGSIHIPKDKVEQQADKFATFFLMPKKLVQGAFRELFAMEKMVINPNTVFGLTNTAKVSDFKEMYGDRDGFALFVASAEFFGGREFHSLADTFGVSKKAMARRLLELELVDF
jgi:Zn-dependent peptidase ImmA (M78 family)